MTEKKYQRSKKNLLIIPSFQGRMLLLIVLVGFACSIFNGYLYYDYVDDSYRFILKYSSLSQELIDQRHRDLFIFGMALGGASLLITLIIATWALVITHRAAGAVYHVRRVIEEIRSGNLTERVHLREKDEFKDLADSFNQMMDELQKTKSLP
jgi:nitrogen fixation/metabolism regulation signal transduction histidine kinase